MTRGDRLLTLVAELRAAAPDPVPAGALARRLGVSVSTVRRDLELLARGGLPLRFARGRGYVLAEPPDPPVPSEAASLVGPVRRALAEAVRARRVVRIDYTDQAGLRSRRDVEAHGLVVAPYGEYLVGWCRLREGPRMFRLDRIGAAFVTGREAGLRELDDLLAVLRVPPPRPPADAGPGPRGPAGAARARAWTLDRLRYVRERLADLVGEVRDRREGAARARTVLGHLAEWSRWQVAAVRAVATGGELRFDGRRPPFPPGFDDRLPFAERERMIQDAMALRSLAELARDLDQVLDAVAHWAADCDDALWEEPLPDPARPSRSRPLADLLAGWQSPLAHIEWHLDRLAGEPAGPWADWPDADEEESWVVDRCPLQV
jgi:predicted DNA-binding transcriptional regulator YafY